MSSMQRHSPSLSVDAAGVMRQALAGMLWSKQFFFYDVGQWLKAARHSAVQSQSAFDPQRPLGTHAQRGHGLDAG